MLSQRWRAALPFLVVGSACVVAGGCVAAATGLAPSEHGAWAAAYLVLVAGVAQVALGAGQAGLAPRVPSRVTRAGQLVLWNAGNAGVLTGTLLGIRAALDVGGALLVVALLLLVRGARGAPVDLRWGLRAFRALVLLLLISIPAGLVLATVRPV